MQVTRGINEAQQLAATPFLRTSVTESNRSYVDKDEKAIQSIIKAWQKRWRQRDKQSEFPLFINLDRHELFDSMARYPQRRLCRDFRHRQPRRPCCELHSAGRVLLWQDLLVEAVMKGGIGAVFVSDLFFDPAFGTHVLNVSVPILDDEQHVAIGAITILLRRDTLFHSVSEVTVGQTGHAMLFNSDGVPLICPVLSPEEHAVTPELLSAINAGRAGWSIVANDSHGGQNSIVGFAPVRLGDHLTSGSLGSTRWVTFVRQDPHESYAPLLRLVIQVTVYGLGVLGVLVLTGLAVARRIARPIRLLQEGVQRIGSGRLDQQLNLKTGDEIEQLADAFNNMAINLRASFEQIEDRDGDVRRLEARYRDLIEHSPEIIYQLNKAGQFVHVNKTGLDKLGYSLEEMLQMRLWDLVPKGRETEVLGDLERLVAQGRSTIETVFVAGDGHPIDVEIHATALFESGGGLVHSRAFVRDVTERRLLEQQIQQYTTQLEQAVNERTQQLVVSQARYKALFDLVADSVFMVGEDGLIVAVNKREEQALGYSERRSWGSSILNA